MRSLSSGHGRYFAAAHQALGKQLEEAERAARGKAPGGQAVTPLPPDVWATVAPHLARLESLSLGIARRHAPESVGAANAPLPLLATARWTALLLQNLEETLEDLEPDAIARKFGPFPAPDAAAETARDVAEMHASLRAAQDALEAFRQALENPDTPARSE